MNNKFQKLPDNLKALCKFYAWLKYDFLNNSKSDDYFRYASFRYWLMRELDTWYDLDVSEIPDIKSNREHLKTWFELDRNIDKNSLLKADYQKDYEIKPRYEGLALIES